MATESKKIKRQGHIMKDVLAHGKEFEFYFKCCDFNQFVEHCHMFGQELPHN